MALNPFITYVVLISVFRTSETIKTYHLNEGCENGTLKTVLTVTGMESSASFASWRTIPSISNCELSIETEPGYGVAVVFYQVNLSDDPTQCQSFLQICEDTNSTAICRGKQLCKLKNRLSMLFNDGVRIRYVSTQTSKDSFLFTVTSYKAAQHQQCGEAFLCDNRICIWKGFECDKTNNCGDGSDEIHCKLDWHLYIRIILAIFFGVVFILLCVVCFVYCYHRNTRRKNGVTYQYVIT